MASTTEIRLVSSEIATLWTTYITDSMSVCVLKHFLSNVQDAEVCSVIEYAQSLAQDHLNFITTTFNAEGHAIPKGFTDEDLDIKAPRLFSDSYYLYYMRLMGTLALQAYSVAVPLMARQDVFDFFSGNLQTSLELAKRVTNALLSKGLFIRPPFVESDNTVDFVKDRNFLSGIFGKYRNLLTIEITHLYTNLESNVDFRMLLSGFAQTAKTPLIRDFMLRGKHLAEKHVEMIASTLKEDDVSAPITWDNYLSDSTIAPFSEKLMLFHTNLLAVARFVTYASALAASNRTDLEAEYLRLLAAIAKFTSEGRKMMIDYGWFEQPPEAINHEFLRTRG